MDGIRPFERSDLPQVADLYHRVMRAGSGAAPAGLQAGPAQTLLESPWRDPEIPSLVSQESDDRIVGFVGVHTRRIVFGGRRVRLACSGQLVVNPESCFSKCECPACPLREALNDDVANDLAMNVGQPVVATLKTIRQSLVVDAQQM